MLHSKSHFTSVVILPIALALLAGCAAPDDGGAANMLQQADAALAARDFEAAKRAYAAAYDEAKGPSRDEIRYSARLGVTRIDAAATPSRAEAFAKDTREPNDVIGDILKARRSLRQHGSDQALEQLLIQAQNTQTARQLAIVKEHMARGQTFAALKGVEKMAALPDLSEVNQLDIQGIRTAIADQHRKAAGEATKASLPFTARFHTGMAAAAERTKVIENGPSLTQRLTPKFEAVTIRGGGSECEPIRKDIEDRLLKQDFLVESGDGLSLQQAAIVQQKTAVQHVTVDINNFKCVRDVQESASTENVRYMVKQPYTYMKSYDEQQCKEIPRSTSVHTYCSGVYHKPGTSGLYNPNCDVREVTVPAHTKCETVKRQREETAIKEVERIEPRKRVTRLVSWTATGSMSLKTKGSTTIHPLKMDASEEGVSYPAVGTHPKADFPYLVSDNAGAHPKFRERLALAVSNEAVRFAKLRLELDLGDTAARLANAQSRGKIQEADEIALRAAAFGKRVGDYLEQRFGVTNSVARSAFNQAPNFSENPPIIPQFEKIILGDGAIPVKSQF